MGQPRIGQGGMGRQMDGRTDGIGRATPAFSPHREVTQSLSFQSSLLPSPAVVAHGDKSVSISL